MPNTTVDIYRANNAPPAAPDVAAVPCTFVFCYDLGRERGEREQQSVRFVAMMYVAANVDIRDAFNAWVTGGTFDTVYLPDANGVAYTVNYVERKGYGTSSDQKVVYLDRKAINWPWPNVANPAAPGAVLPPPANPLPPGGTVQLEPGLATATISKLASAATLTGAELFIVVQSSEDVNVNLNTVAAFLTALSGTVTSVGVSVPSFLSVADSPVTTAGTIAISLTTQPAAQFLGGPATGANATPAFRALLASDVPTLNQNTTGTASNVTGTVAIANGGTGHSSQQAAMNTLAGAQTAGQYLRGNGTNVTMSAIQAADVPTLNQNTTGSSGSCAGNAATVTTNANLTGPITSVGNATSIAAQTGTGTTFVMSVSPTFTGTPAAPTASTGTNTTQIATTAFVQAAPDKSFPNESSQITGPSTNTVSHTYTAPSVATVQAQIVGAMLVVSTTSGSITIIVTVNWVDAGGNNRSVTMTPVNYASTVTSTGDFPYPTITINPGEGTTITVTATVTGTTSYYLFSWTAHVN